ncbi:MAG: hypothetical protein MJ230_00950 [bacterium]|nr:hypothetical protein [bacterium]
MSFFSKGISFWNSLKGVKINRNLYPRPLRRALKKAEIVNPSVQLEDYSAIRRLPEGTEIQLGKNYSVFTKNTDVVGIKPNGRIEVLSGDRYKRLQDNTSTVRERIKAGQDNTFENDYAWQNAFYPNKVTVDGKTYEAHKTTSEVYHYNDGTVTYKPRYLEEEQMARPVEIFYKS